ncbi:helix-turn-helix transcriptional regulator [Pseudoxanthomonas winnipegensis]|uniref:helix-turn-helix transcriptional regulator n=1 Tax=Pseudoxanthomonas winnipegensis TaxID=2480810 RepID=UPI003F85B688
MNHALPARQTLLADLATLADCARAEGFACIAARREHGAQSVDIPGPQVAILLQGRKQVSTATQLLAFEPGDLFLITRACRIDVINTPDAASGLYLTAVIPLCAEVLEAARLLWTELLPQPGQALARLPIEDFATALPQWRQALAEGRYAEARLVLAGMVVALCRRGYGSLLLPPEPTLAAQVQALVADQPERDWQSRDVEQALSLSGATLRRRLAAERTSLRQLIVEARLARAMELLYTTRWPLKTIAARVGYRSARSFSQRFQQRYGLDPARIGNQLPD